MGLEGNVIPSADDEIPLAEATIHHIQSFMGRKEAARTTVLSRAWYKAWLTRPDLDFDSNDFHRIGRTFEHFANGTFRRYQDLDLNIESFKLRSNSDYDSRPFVHSLIMRALRFGATDLQLEVSSMAVTLPQEVLGSQTLLRLSLNGCRLDRKSVISCSRLKSLTLKDVDIPSIDVFEDIISCCTLIEEFLYTKGSVPEWEQMDKIEREKPRHRLNQMNPFELHKLRHLLLYNVDFGSVFYSNFATRFPRLKDLSILGCCEFEELERDTTQRCPDLSLKTENFSLRCSNFHSLLPNLIASATEMGATDVKLELTSSISLPREVLKSKNLIKLSLMRCKLHGNYVVRCSRLKSLTLEHVDIRSGDGFLKDIISCCILMEELTLSNCYGFALERMNPFELHRLKRLFLRRVGGCGSIFSPDFASRFPCLTDLSILECHGLTDIKVASNSLQTITFKTKKGSDGAEFDVPNLRKFTYSAFGLPTHLSIDGPSREWEFDISIACNRSDKASWFVNLKRLLKKFRLSIISLCINVHHQRKPHHEHDEVEIEAAPTPLVVENLMIEAPSTSRPALLVCLIEIFKPKYVDEHRWRGAHWKLWREYRLEPIDVFRERLIDLLIVSDFHDLFGELGIKKVNVEAYKMVGTEWRPIGLEELEASGKPVDRQKIRLQMIWEDSLC